MMKSMKLGARMATVFTLLGAMVLGIAGLGGWQIRTLRGDAADIAKLMEVRVLLSQWQAYTGVNATRTAVALQSADEKLADVLAPAMKATSATISGLQKRIEAMPLSESEKQAFEAVGAARKGYIASRDETLKLKKAGDPKAAELYASKFNPALKGYENAMSAFIEGYSKTRLDAQAAADAASTRMLQIMGGICGAFVLLAAFMAYALTRSITRPLSRAVELADRVAQGDLSGSIDVRSRDEVGRLSASLNRMNDNLKGIVTDVRSATATILNASGEIATGNADLSNRTEEQASALEETASSMEELTSTVKQNADNARQANELAAAASAIAVQGGRVVGNVVARMTAISDSSKKIADIISVIDGIAFQTNILALNAAVEAARAGEQGRGFAVVASEVRTLAQRSAGAAKEIKQLIGTSVSEVEDGSRLVAEAGRTMEDMVKSVERVTTVVADISAANSEQNGGIEQINAAIMQMDNTTQQNAALVEEAAAAAESMRTQAERLTEAIAVFRLGGETPAADRPAVREPRRGKPAKAADKPREALAA